MNPKFTTVTVSLHRDLAERLRKKFPKYGELSRAMRSVIEQILEGRIKPTTK